jgi:lipopolysaccharide transport system ATP-binding protein
MTEPIIRVENLGKKYLLKHKAGGERYRALRDVLTSGLKTGFGLFAKHGQASATREEFWALKDVSFEVNEGEVVGIIGRNGAGKSTLLKILSRITEPTTGRVTLNGRVASLLEVGTGFHPELTGRENIYLNGTVLGMRRAEIARKFDEIVAFAEVEKFLDTPVKRYSSGMYVRLAFAVAAHLEPEILVVDEVLAVGDAAFQKKCLGKMSEVARGGRTVLFVSHNMGAIKTLCTSGVLLREGHVEMTGRIDEIVKAYNTTLQQHSTLMYEQKHPGPDYPHFTRIEIQQPASEHGVLAMHEAAQVVFDIDTRSVSNLIVGVIVRNAEGTILFDSSDEFADHNLSHQTRRICRIPPYALAEGEYYLTAGLAVRNVTTFDRREDVLFFKVEFSGRMQERMTGRQWRGVCGPGLLMWS